MRLHQSSLIAITTPIFTAIAIATAIVAIVRRALLAHGQLCSPTDSVLVVCVRAGSRRDVVCPEAGDLDVGTLLELVEVSVEGGWVPMAFISALAHAPMACGKWCSLGRELGVRLVRLDCVECAVTYSKCMTLAYRPYVLR